MYTLDLYYLKIIINEFFFKLNLIILFFFFSYFFFKFIDFFKFNVYIFSRLFRNIRLNFLFFNFIVTNQLKKFLNNRKQLYFLNIFFINFSSIFFFINFEYLLFEIFRIFYKYNLSLFLFFLKKKKSVLLIWNDIYSNLVDLNDLIIYRDLFLFKYELPHLIYYLYFYFYDIFLSVYLLSFFGLKFFLKKKKFKFNFYSKIL